MKDIKYNQNKEIEKLLFEITKIQEYKKVEYIAFSMHKPMLDYFRKLKGVDNTFKIPHFLQSLVERVGELFQESDVTWSNILSYMNEKDRWAFYYDTTFIRGFNITDKIQVDENFVPMIITGFILDRNKKRNIDIKEIITGEIFKYETNQYKLTKVSGVEFKMDSFIFDGKAYLYNILTNKSKIDFKDKMPGFARIFTEDVDVGDVLLRVDERLALPKEDIISYSTFNYKKFRGPQFNFSNTNLSSLKTIIVHIDVESYNKLLMVIKKDYDDVREKEFLHIEIETLPYHYIKNAKAQCITTFLHGMYYPDKDVFTHIDFTKNQYNYSDYEKKYWDADPNVPIDFHTKKGLHYKIWCIENGEYSREIWYKLMVVSLKSEYRSLLDEILSK